MADKFAAVFATVLTESNTGQITREAIAEIVYTKRRQLREPWHKNSLPGTVESLGIRLKEVLEKVAAVKKRFRVIRSVPPPEAVFCLEALLFGINRRVSKTVFSILIFRPANGLCSEFDINLTLYSLYAII